MDNEIKNISVKEFWSLIKGHRKASLILVFFSITAALCEAVSLNLIVPITNGIINNNFSDNNFISKFVLELAFNKDPNKNILNLFFIFSGLILLKSFFLILQTFISNHFTWSLSKRWTSNIQKRYLLSPFSYLSSHEQGELFHNTLTAPVQASSALLRLNYLLVKGSMTLALALVLIISDFELSIKIAIIAAIFYKLIIKRFSNFFKKNGEEDLDCNQQIDIKTNEIYKNGLEIRLNNLFEYISKIYLDLLERQRKVRIKINVSRALPVPVIESILAIVVFVSIFIIIKFNNIQIKDVLPQIAMYIIVGQRLFSNLSNFLSQKAFFLTGLPYISLVYKLTNKDFPQESFSKGDNLKKINTDISFENVSFSPENTDLKIFDGLNLKLIRNKFNAIIGPSGSGKTTLTRLLLGLYSPSQGQITVNEQSLNNYSKVSWREKIGHVDQEVRLFSGSIKMNIKLGRPNATDDEIYQALSQSGLKEFIDSKKEGIDFEIGESGARLSGGQRQRLAIARALVRSPELLIFDEATSALDKYSEQIINETIKKFKGKITIVVIAHKASSIVDADVVHDLGKL